MRKLRVYVLWIAIALALAGLLIWAISPSEPHYEGKSLSEWLRDPEAHVPSEWIWDSQPPELRVYKCDEAIRNIGTNAIPYLLKWIAYKPPAWKRVLYRAGDSVLGRLSSDWELPDCSQRGRADAAFRALLLLGTNADSALPDVRRIFNAEDTAFDWDRAAYVRSSPLRMASINAKGPAIAKLLDAYNARLAWPVVQKLLTNESPELRTYATNVSRIIQHDDLGPLPPARRSGP